MGWTEINIGEQRNKVLTTNKFEERQNEVN